MNTWSSDSKAEDHKNIPNSNPFRYEDDGLRMKEVFGMNTDDFDKSFFRQSSDVMMELPPLQGSHQGKYKAVNIATTKETNRHTVDKDTEKLDSSGGAAPKVTSN